MSSILFLADLNPEKFGSMEEHALFLCDELRKRGHQCYLGFSSQPHRELLKAFTDAGAKLLVIDFMYSLSCFTSGKLGNLSLLFTFIRKNRIDLVHLNLAGITIPTFWGVFMTPAKIVFTDHDSGFFYRSRWKNVISRVMHHFISRRVSKYTGVSNYVRRRLCSSHHVGFDRTVTLYNGVNLERFKPADAVAARSQLGLPLDRKILTTVAALIPEKGVQHLVEAVAILVHELDIKSILAVVTGDGPYRCHLENLARERDVSENFRFFGRRNDVQVIISAADIVVVPSVWQEAFGLIIAESMACARPVVASRTGGIPELIEDGVSGLHVDPGDNRGLATAIHDLLQNAKQRQQLSSAALLKARCEFDLARQVIKLADLYEEVISG